MTMQFHLASLSGVGKVCQPALLGANGCASLLRGIHQEPLCMCLSGPADRDRALSGPADRDRATSQRPGFQIASGLCISHLQKRGFIQVYFKGSAAIEQYSLALRDASLLCGC